MGDAPNKEHNWGKLSAIGTWAGVLVAVMGIAIAALISTASIVVTQGSRSTVNGSPVTTETVQHVDRGTRPPLANTPPVEPASVPVPDKLPEQSAVAPATLVPDTRGEPSGGVSTVLSVSGAAPTIVECHGIFNEKGCFRIVFQIEAAKGGNVEIAAPPGNGYSLFETIAVAATGVSCKGSAVDGLPSASEDFNQRLSWGPGAPFITSTAKRAIFIVDFRCDGAIVALDEVQVQLMLAVDPDGRGIQMARYVFPRMKVRGKM